MIELAREETKPSRRKESSQSPQQPPNKEEPQKSSQPRREKADVDPSIEYTKATDPSKD